eukprot:1160870-Pelagomonas_calceolata.AAC.3
MSHANRHEASRHSCTLAVKKQAGIGARLQVQCIQKALEGVPGMRVAQQGDREGPSPVSAGFLGTQSAAAVHPGAQLHAALPAAATAAAVSTAACGGGAGGGAGDGIAGTAATAAGASEQAGSSRSQGQAVARGSRHVQVATIDSFQV